MTTEPQNAPVASVLSAAERGASWTASPPVRPAVTALRPTVACTDCGGRTRRPARSHQHGGLICRPCLHIDTHATCARCRRYRAVERRDDTGKPLCKACAGENPASHPCPDCGDIVPGPGASRCMPCGLHHRIVRNAGAYAARLEQVWVRDLFLEFHAGIDARRAPGDMARRTPSHFAFFQRIGRHCSNTDDLTQGKLLELFGAEDLRRMERIVAFLVNRISIAWNERLSVAHSAETIALRTLAEADGEPFGPELRHFYSCLVARNLSARTRKSYLTAAFGLMKHAGITRTNELTQTNVTGWLHRRRGQAASLGRFLSWIEKEGGPSLTAHGRPKTPDRKRERQTIKTARTLMQQLENARSTEQHRAILARTSALFIGIPLEEILSLRANDIQIQENGVLIFTSGRDEIMLPPDFCPHFARAITENSQIFEGRQNYRTKSPDGTRYHTSNPKQNHRKAFR